MKRADQNLLSLGRALYRVCLTPFDDEDFKSLLIQLRPHLGGSPLEQTAHAVAHPDQIALGALHDYLEDLHSAFYFQNAILPSSDFPRQIPKRFLTIASARLGAEKLQLQGLYKEGEQEFVLRSQSDQDAASALLRRAFSNFTVKPALSARELLVPEIRAAVERARPPATTAWVELLEGATTELSIALIAALNGTTIKLRSGFTCWLSLATGDPLRVIATIPTVKGRPHFSAPYLDTDLLRSEHVSGEIGHQRLLDGSTAAVPCVAARGRDGRLKLKSAWRQTQLLAVVAESVLQDMKTQGATKADAIARYLVHLEPD